VARGAHLSTQSSSMALDSYISSIEWLVQRKPVERMDYWLYAAIAAVSVQLHLQLMVDYEVWVGAVWCIAVLASSLVYLSQQWSMAIKCRFQYHVARPPQAQFVLVKPSGVGGSLIVPLEFSLGPQNGSDGPEWIRLPERRFVFHSLTFEVDAIGSGDMTIRRAAYPEREALTYYSAWKGWSHSEAARASARFGSNAVQIPLPSFSVLFKEHATAPLFVFQVFSVILWTLDEYFLYSLWTLATLVGLEAVLVYQRIKTAETLRGMRPPPYLLYVMRDGRWQVTSSSSLVPLDIVSLNRMPVKATELISGGTATAPAADTSVVCPADVLLLAGGVVVNEAMLTGESAALTKEAIDPESADDASSSHLDAFNMASDRNHVRHVVFGGTSVLQKEETTENPTGLPLPPDGGAIGVVLHTGSGTMQAELLRTIVHGSERVSVSDRDALIFIAVLLVFALAASGYVLHYGLQDPDRNKWSLVLHCIMIITSVVPPELPVELSLAVNNSVAVLMRRGIFCTEPFRLPMAGKVDVCAFDKTGTLTADEFKVRSLTTIGADGSASDLTVGAAPEAARLILLGCHALVGRAAISLPPPPTGQSAASQQPQQPQAQQPVGDPIEQAAVASLGWTVNEQRITLPAKDSSIGRGKVRIVHRWPFSATLKRMSCCVTTTGFASGGVVQDSAMYIVVKGAPEALLPLLRDSPPNYLHHYNRLACSGARVLALAYRSLPAKTTESHVRTGLPRGDAESDLHFAGFLSVVSPTKTDSARTIKELQDSGHRVLIITGDAPMTAIAVAAQLGLRPYASLFELSSGADAQPRFLVDVPTSKEKDPLKPFALTAMTTDGNLDHSARHEAQHLATAMSTCGSSIVCITGAALQVARTQLDAKAFDQICMSAQVFARVSPAQKEWVITAFNTAGYCTAMTGDGSNDTAALKQSHIGLAVVSNPTLEKKYDQARLKQIAARASVSSAASKLTVDDDTEIAALLQSERAKPVALAAPVPIQPPKDVSEMMAAVNEQLKQMEAESGELGAVTVALGDASMAAPFTSKLPTPGAILDIIRQGRCTLVSVQTMYQILAINSLVLSYMMSVLYLHDVKSSDTQATVSGMSAAAFFLFISWSRPLQRLSPERPSSSVFNPRLLWSIVLQFAVHLTALVTTVAIISPLSEAAKAAAAAARNVTNQTDIPIAGDIPVSVTDSDLSKIFGDVSAEPEATGSGTGLFGTTSTFVPNVVSSAVFVVSNAIQTCTFLVSYYGPPFMEPLTGKAWLVRGGIAMYIVCVLGALGVSEDLNDYFQLVPLPEEWQRLALAAIIILDAVLVFGIDAVLRSACRPKLNRR
jgi:cation-transporting ATPase 13A1